MARDGDDDLPRREAPQSLPLRDLGPLSLSELNAYIEELEREILRVRHDIAAKQQHLRGAESIFRR